MHTNMATGLEMIWLRISSFLKVPVSSQLLNGALFPSNIVPLVSLPF